MIDEALKQWATDRQIELIDAVNEHGSQRKASKVLGINAGTISKAMDRIKTKAAIHGYSPQHDMPKPDKVKSNRNTHLYLPDVQAKPDVDFTFLRAIGNYIVAKKPNVIICAGDFADMESLSTYDVGLKSFEGRAYKKDIWAAREAMDALLTPMFEYNAQAQNPYKPRMVLIVGNHENRIDRAINSDRKLEGLISIDDLPYQDWEVIPFLEVKVIDGIAYSHYFTSGVMGRPITSAQALLTKKHMSCVAGHQQGRQIAFGQRADGKEMTAIISGSCYEHDESYLGAQGNIHWRGFWLFHNVNDGSFDECAVPISYVKEHYL
jgi:hypothetical protein